MDKQRESFLFYRDWWNSLKKTPEIRHEVIDALMAKVFDDEAPAASPLAEMALSFILPVIERDTDKYQERCERNADNARKRWERKNANACERIQSNANGGDNDNVNDNGNDNDNELPLMSNIVKEEEEEEKGKSEKIRIKDFCQIWNRVLNKRKQQQQPTPLKPIYQKSLPEDAEERVNNAVHEIESSLTPMTAHTILDSYGIVEPYRTMNTAAKYYIIRAIDNMSTVKMKPRDTSFGSFQWFFAKTSRIKKLYNGDIQ